MVHNETRLFELIHGSINPERAVQTAIKVFSAFLEQLEACLAQQADKHQESA